MQRSSDLKPSLCLAVYALCLCVFLLSFYAKVSVYDSGAAVNPAASAKLWASGAKMEHRSTIVVTALAWLAVLMLVMLHGLVRRAPVATLALAPAALPTSPAFQPYLYLRPPPDHFSL